MMTTTRKVSVALSLSALLLLAAADGKTREDNRKITMCALLLAFAGAAVLEIKERQ